jgi:hypothetical protein
MAEVAIRKAAPNRTEALAFLAGALLLIIFFLS